MFSFLGGLFVLLLTRLWSLPRRIVEGLDQAIDGGVDFFHEWLHGTDESSQQAIAAARSSVGPPGDWWTWLWSFVVRSFVRPTPLARVRVPARRSIR
jgi:hypothetical protein